MHELKYSVFLAGNGWAVYEDVPPEFLELPFVTRRAPY